MRHIKRLTRLFLLASAAVLLTATPSPRHHAQTKAGAENQPDEDKPAADRTDFAVHFIDDPLGHSAIIDIGEHEIVIDGGGKRDTLVNYIRRTNIIDGPIELVVLTNSLASGRAGLRGLFGLSSQGEKSGPPAAQVLELWEPGYEKPNDKSSYPAFISSVSGLLPDGALKRPLERFHAPATMTGKVEPFKLASIPEATFTVLHSNSHPEGDLGNAPHNSSIVLMVEVAGVRMLFPGHIQGKSNGDPPTVEPKGSEGELVKLAALQPGALKADLLLAPRDGSESSSTQKFIDAVSPRLVVFAGAPRFDLPSPTVVSRYQKVAHVYSTGAHAKADVDNIVCETSPLAPFMRGGFDENEDEAEGGSKLKCRYWSNVTEEGLLEWQGRVKSAKPAKAKQEGQKPKGIKPEGGDKPEDKEILNDERIADFLRQRSRKQEEPDEDEDPPDLLVGADLTGADLSSVDFHRTDLSGANLSWADLSGADMTGVSLRGANLSFSYLDPKTTLAGADLSEVSLPAYGLPLDLSGTILSGADLRGINLRGARLVGGRLDKARLVGADLTGATFEPQSGFGPDFNELTTTQHLETLTFDKSPHALVELREAFKKAGLREQERRLTYAIEHEKNEENWRQGKWAEYFFNRILFDFTSSYGMLPGRSLLLLGISILLFSVPYMFALWFRGRGGIWAVWLPDRVEKNKGKNEPERMTATYTRVRTGWLRKPARVLRVILIGLYFSLVSAFQVGYHDFNIGNWISRIQASEYSLRPTGWVRVVSGIQSLLSLFLLAIWVLTYFGRPFD